MANQTFYQTVGSRGLTQEQFRNLVSDPAVLRDDFLPAAWHELSLLPERSLPILISGDHLTKGIEILSLVKMTAISREVLAPENKIFSARALAAQSYLVTFLSISQSVALQISQRPELRTLISSIFEAIKPYRAATWADPRLLPHPGAQDGSLSGTMKGIREAYQKFEPGSFEKLIASAEKIEKDPDYIAESRGWWMIYLLRPSRTLPMLLGEEKYAFRETISVLRLLRIAKGQDDYHHSVDDQKFAENWLRHLLQLPEVKAFRSTRPSEVAPQVWVRINKLLRYVEDGLSQ